MFTYPFCYCNVTNNSGTTIPFRFEDSTEVDDLTNKKCLTFYIYGAITPSLSMKAVPINYKKVAENYNYGIMLGKLPVCSWTSDVYVNWLTQNGTNATLNVLSSAVGAIGSGVAQNPLGVFAGAAVTQVLGKWTDGGSLGTGFAMLSIVVAVALALQLICLKPKTDNME